MSTPSPSAGTSIVDNNALTGALRTLKLGGMLQTLDARLAQARAGELGHLEFPPRHHRDRPPHPTRPVRTDRDVGGVRLHRQPQTPGRADP